jgi:CRP-like cAMP-binding protein
MRSGAATSRRRLEPGDTLVEQGEEGRDMFLLLDGVLDVAVDDEVVAQVGPGAILGERALLEGGVRTATLRAVTACRVVVFSGFALDADALAALADTRRREEN